MHQPLWKPVYVFRPCLLRIAEGSHRCSRKALWEPPALLLVLSAASQRLLHAAVWSQQCELRERAMS